MAAEGLSRDGHETTLRKAAMGISDRLKDLKTKAVDATVERSDKIHEAVEKVASTADERTGGKYRERIQNASAKAGSLVDGLKGSEQEAGAQGEDVASVDTQAAPTTDAESAPPVADADSTPTQ
jgi:hypothetical protein